MDYSYERAFSRNLGWVNDIEQEKIRNTVVGIPGLGGVGGHHVHALARLGFSKFKIADFDDFDLHNFNRQVGANMDTIGKTKIEVTEKMIKSINPEAEVTLFDKGINADNAEEFLAGTDLILDSIDLYVLDLRELLYGRAHELGIPVVTAAPLGMGTSVLAFVPGKMGFNEYFNLKKDDDNLVKVAKFLAGVAPRPHHLRYLKYREYVNINERKVPSLHVGVTTSTSAITAVCLKLVLNRGKVIAAPRGYHVDFYLNKWKNFYIPFGNKNPIQKVIIWILLNKYFKQP